MANKKRRKQTNRPRQEATVRTAERPPRDDVADARPTRSARPARNGNDAASQRSRAEKKELARRQREEVRRQIRRQQIVRSGVRAVVVLAVVGGAVLWFARPDGEPATTDQLEGLLRTEAPWDKNSELAADRADAIHLPAHGAQLAMHIHANLRVFVHGTEYPVPVDVGIDGADVASLHTHTGDGLVHVESSTVDEFTLKQFFDVWGVRYTSTCLGAYCNGPEGELRVFVDGQEFTGDPETIPLEEESVIVVTYGTEDELPDPIPTTFDFASINP